MLRKAAIGLFLLLLFAPLGQWSLSPLPKVELLNYHIERQFPQLSFASFTSEKFQRGLENWFRKNCGLIGIILRTANQINYSVFGQISGGYSASILLGKEGVLYQSLYVDDLNGRASARPKQLERLAERLAAVRTYLHSHGKGLLLLISTNKVSLYPEWLANRHRSEQVGRVPRKIDYLRRFLGEQKLDGVDAYKLLAPLRASTNYPFFPKSGSHWNSAANCLVARELTAAMGRELAAASAAASEGIRQPNRTLRELQCGRIKELRKRPRSPDRDLARAINVWDASASYDTTPYIEVRSNIEQTVFQPRVLFVGTSFLWAVMELMERHKVYQERDMYFYGKTNYFLRRDQDGAWQRGKRPVEYEGRDWLKRILEYDLVIFEANEALADQLGFDLLRALTKQLPHSPAAAEER